ncbi:PepSY domain-containing protein [Advenella alkanexedens]|uniref:PepSY domain-containing protein n=1 Tax=Advenella alkanexedens TaxID=1481665 RepID=UPI0026744191|nr:PepSY domain-containing protein [Advenella alkanexedens]WKU18287.1 PepSY domain-containing protein [Advenella alkanexedens]
MKTTRLLTALTLGSSLIFSGAALNTALAQTTTTQMQTAPAQSRLNIKQIYDKVEAAGYTNITEIDLDDNVYEVKARNQENQRVELKLDPKTGEIIKTKTKNK